MRFDGKVAVVTGSTRGWGLAIAHELGERGARVVVNGTTELGVAAAVESVRALGGECVGIVESVSSPNGAMILHMQEEKWDEVIGIQLNGVLYCAHHAARQMVAQGKGGVIINMAGSTGVFGMYGNANSAATKGALLAASQTLALELWPYDIRVNAVRAAMQTDTMAPFIEKMREQLQRPGEPVLTPRDLGYYQPEEPCGLVT